NIIRVSNWLEAVQWIKKNKHHIIRVNN
ncbi:hypothetical protein MOF52_23245, partial [Bacillus inaquosorum]|nr:hypothetical protein [Bacillus inaquosorum]